MVYKGQNSYLVSVWQYQIFKTASVRKKLIIVVIKWKQLHLVLILIDFNSTFNIGTRGKFYSNHQFPIASAGL